MIYVIHLQALRGVSLQATVSALGFMKLRLAIFHYHRHHSSP